MDLPRPSPCCGRSTLGLALAVWLLVTICLTGCDRFIDGRRLPRLFGWGAPDERNDSAPGTEAPDPPADDTLADVALADGRAAANRAGLREALAGHLWLPSLGPAAGSTAETPWRWQHEALEAVLTAGPAVADDLHKALADDDSVVATNAAIGLARLGDGAGMDRLVATAGTPLAQWKYLRCAAVEALGSITDPSPAPALRQLLDRFGGSRRQGESFYFDRLDGQLIRALARHAEEADRRYFLDAMSNRPPVVRPVAVRLAASEAWADHLPLDLSDEAADLWRDSDSRVRMAALAALAARRHPKAVDYLWIATTDYDPRVRQKAVASLGVLGTDAALEKLHQLLSNQSELLRAEAVGALSVAGTEEAVWKAAADEAWRVRLVVAKALERFPTRQAARTARALIDDRSSQVQRQVVESVASWPVALAGPVLLAAMEKSGYLVPNVAADRLSAIWPPAAEFTREIQHQRRLEVVGRLREQFRRDIGFIDPKAVARASANAGDASTRSLGDEHIAGVEHLLAQLAGPSASAPVRQRAASELIALGPRLVETLAHLAIDRHQVLPEAVFRDVLPHCHGVFATLDEFASADVTTRRRAAGALVEWTAERPLGRLAATRLAELVIPEPDQLVWQNVLRATLDDPGEPAARLAHAAMTHPSPEVRRRACDYFQKHPDPRHLGALLFALEDPSVPVVFSAVRALGAAGRLDDPWPIERLLGSSNQRLRVEAAISLCHLQQPSGPAALERLSYSNDPEIRRRVAIAMGELADQRFLTTLIRLLEDRRGAASEALAALPRIVGYDAAENDGQPTSMTRRIHLWQRWADRQREAIRAEDSIEFRQPAGSVRNSPIPLPDGMEVGQRR